MKSRKAAAAAVLLFLFVLTFQAHPSSFSSYSQIESTAFPVVIFYLCVGAFLMFLIQLLWLPRSVVVQQKAEPPSLLHEAESAVQLGDISAAKALLKQIDSGHPDYWMRLKLEGDLAILNADLNQAEHFYQQSLSRMKGPATAIVSLALAHLYEQTDRPERAEDLYREILQHAPGAMEPLLRLRALMIQEQDWRQALVFQEFLEERYSEVLDSREERRIRAGIRYELARNEAEQESWKNALALLKHVTRLDDNFTPAYLLMGHVQEKLENDTAAFRAWERGYDATGHPVLLQRIYEAFLLRNLPDRAIEFLRGCIERSPENPVPEFCLADLFMKLEMVQEAIRVHERIGQQAPDWLLNKVRMAEACRRAGQDLRAARIVGSLLEALDPMVLWKCSDCEACYSEYTSFCLACSGWNTLELNNNQAGKVDSHYEDSIRPRLRSTK